MGIGITGPSVTSLSTVVVKTASKMHIQLGEDLLGLWLKSEHVVQHLSRMALAPQE